jgi:hypothetical protein
MSDGARHQLQMRSGSIIYRCYHTQDLSPRLDCHGFELVSSLSRIGWMLMDDGRRSERGEERSEWAVVSNLFFQSTHGRKLKQDLFEIHLGMSH